MSLMVDPAYKKVTCPNCGHKWWQHIDVSVKKCTSCGAPLTRGI